MNAFLPWFNAHHSDYQAVLFDIDGTLTSGPHPLPGNARTISRLREMQYPFFFLTNDGLHSHAEKCLQLRRGGVEAQESEIVSSADALVQAARVLSLQGKNVAVLGAWAHQVDYLYAAQINPVPLSEIQNAVALYVGEGDFDWFTDIQLVINHLRLHPMMPVVTANPDAIWAGRPDGGFGVGAGSIARFILEVLSNIGVKPPMYFLGKPNAGIYQATLERLQEKFGIRVDDPCKILSVGDALFSDICGGNRAGMTTVLMMTGVTSPEALAVAPQENRPALVFDVLDEA